MNCPICNSEHLIEQLETIDYKCGNCGTKGISKDHAHGRYLTRNYEIRRQLGPTGKEKTR